MAFSDRSEAGRLLAEKLSRYKSGRRVIVLAIPRGGVETGYFLASSLKCPLDVVVSKKIPYPGQPELAIGAVCNDFVSLDRELIKLHGISRSYVREESEKLKAAVAKRYSELSGKSSFPGIKGKTAIITDDGIATGHTFLAAIGFVRSRKPAKVIAAIPVGPPDNMEMVRKKCDDLVALEQPPFFMAVGSFYRNFEQLNDNDVRKYVKNRKSDADGMKRKLY